MKKRILAAALCILACVSACGAAEIAPLPIDLSGGMPVSESNYISDAVYEDESIRVTVETHDVRGTKCFVARIKIADPSQLRTAPAYSFTRDQTAPVKTIAERVNAVLAIIGDYFSYQQFVSGGGYLVRQGEIYNQKTLRGRHILTIDANGDFHIESKMDKETLAGYEDAPIINSFNFGPGLVIDGKIIENYRAKFNSSSERTQRCGIAQVKRGELEYICAVTEGAQQSYRGGLTIPEFAEFMYSLGVENAYNLDGGHSTAMIFHGEKLNAINVDSHRPQSDIVYFASAVTED